MKKMMIFILLLRSINITAMNHTLTNLHCDINNKILSFIKPIQLIDLKLSNKYWYNIIKTYLEPKYNNLISFTNAKNKTTAFCCSENMFYILQEHNDCPDISDIITFDHQTLSKNILPNINLSIANNFFIAHGSNIYYTKDGDLGVINIDDEHISSSIIGNNCTKKCSQLYRINDNIISVSNYQYYSDEYSDINIINTINKQIKKINLQTHIHHVDGIDDILLFAKRGGYKLFTNVDFMAHHYTSLSCCDDVIDEPKSISSVSYNNITISCQIYPKLGAKFYHILQNPGVMWITKLAIKLPSSTIKTKLFWYKDILLIIGNMENSNWFLIVYNTDIKKILFSKIYQENLLEVYMIKNNLFLIYKNTDNESNIENINIKTIDLSKWVN